MARAEADPTPVAYRRRKLTPARVVLQVFLVVIALGWVFPVLWAVLNSFRDYAYTSVHGYVSLGGWTLENYTTAWEQGDFTKHFVNSSYITVPAVVATLVPRLLRGLRAGPLQLPVQPRPAGPVHRSQPAATAVPADPAVPPLPGHPAAAVDERLRLDARQLLGSDPGQHRVPDRVLHVRPEQLHEDAAEGALRGRDGRRCQRLATVLAADVAAVPAGRWRPWRRWR